MSGILFNPVGLIDRAALEHLQSKKLLPGFSHWDVWLDLHACAFTVAKMMDEDLLQETRDAALSALASGTDWRIFKQRLKPYLMAKGWWGEQVMIDPLDDTPKLVQLGSTRRLKTIFQTNMATAYAAGHWARIEADQDALPYLRYNPSAADRQRDHHKRFYGLILPVSHPLWQQIFPPNGYGCQCSVSQLTRRQAEREGISAEPQIEYVEVENPRTGQTVRVPKSIEPSFAHNHARKSGNLLELATEKHGTAFAQKLLQQREQWVSERYRMPVEAVKLVELSDNASRKEINRLLIDPLDKKEKLAEAVAGAQLQKQLGVRLVRLDAPRFDGNGALLPSPDFWIEEKGVPKEQWKTVDFMYTMNPDNQYAVDGFNQHYGQTQKRWQKETATIQEHLQKADIVPLDLRYMNAQNRAKLLIYVLSLPKEQRDKILFLVKETK